MVFKIYYQNDFDRNPKREDTLSFYIDAESLADARAIVQEQTDYNIEFIEELSDKALEYEQTNANFKITNF